MKTAAPAMPGKRTLVDALPASPAIQRKPATSPPAQDQKPNPDQAGYLADEYPDHADLGRENDCGPAAILMIIRVQGWETKLNTAMNGDAAFCAVYPVNGLPPASASKPTAAIPSALKQPNETDHEYLERRQIHYIRIKVTGSSVDADTNDPTGYAISVDWLATHIKPLLLAVGLTEREFSVVLGATPEGQGDQRVPGEGFVNPNAQQGQYIGNATNDPNAKDAAFKSTFVKGNDARTNQALSYMKSKLLGGASILLLGNPLHAWGWGGKMDPKRQNTDDQGNSHRQAGLNSGAGHFVVLYDYHPASGEQPIDIPAGTWTVLDPSYRESQTVTCQQLNTYWEDFVGSQLKPIVVSRVDATQALDGKPPTATV